MYMTRKQAKPTPFGRFARKLRIDRSEYTKDMAAHLSVTPGFLSAVETGRRNAPQGWEEIISQAYGLSPTQADELRAVLAASRSYEIVNVAHLPHGDRHLVVGLADILPKLTGEQRMILERWIQDAQS